MKKILLATEKPFAKVAVEDIKKIAIEGGCELVLLEKYTDKAQLLEAVKDANAMIVRSDKVDAQVIEAAKNLEIVVRAGAGYDNIDLKAATSSNIVVENTPGQNSNAVAELAIGMMLMSAREFYSGKSSYELKGKKLGLLAYGNVSKCLAKIAKGLGMEIYAFDPYVAKAAIEADGIKVVDTKEQLFSTCQYVSLHIPANEQTKKLINYELLSKMPQNGVLVNTARKEVINEEDLMKIMEEKSEFKYVSDIAPDTADTFKQKFEGRVFFTPKKMGAETSEANINAGLAAIKQIVNYFKTGKPTFKVN
mgnify:CR=1 FL=1